MSRTIFFFWKTFFPSKSNFNRYLKDTLVRIYQPFHKCIFFSIFILMRKKPFTPNKKTKLDIFSMENAKEVFRNPDSSSLLDLVFCFLSFRCRYNFQRSLTFTSLNVPQKLFCFLFGNLNLEKIKKNFAI